MAGQNTLLGQSLLDLLSLNADKPEIATIGHSTANATVRFYDNNDPINNAYVMGMSNSTFTLTKRNDDVNTVFAVGTTTPTITKGLEVRGDINYTGDLLQNGELYISSQWTTSNLIDGPNVGSNALVYNVADGLVGIGTDYPLKPLHVEGDIYFTGSLIQNGEEFIGGGGVNNLVTGSNFSYQAIDNMLIDGSKTIITNAASIADRTLYAFSLTAGRYIVTANVPFMNMDGMTLLDNQNWATVSLYRLPILETSVPLGFTSMRINSDSEIITQPLNFVIEAVKYGNYAVVVSGRGHTLKFGSLVHDSRLRVIPIVGAAGLPESISVVEALQVTPAKSITHVTAGPQSVFTLTQDGYFTASPSNVHVYLNGTKYAYVSSTQKDYDFASSYTYDGASKVTATTYTITLEEPAVNNDVVDITVFPVATADTLYSAGYLFQNIEATISPGWNGLQGGGIRSAANKVVIDGDLIVQGGIYGGSNVSGFTFGDRYDVTNLTGALNAGVAVEWAEAFPKPDLRAGTGGSWTSGAKNAWVRYAGNEVLLNFTLAGTVATPATSAANEWRMTLPYIMNSALYTNNAVLGDMIIKITSPDGLSVNTFKAYGRVDTAEPDAIIIKYLTGTTEYGLGSLTTGTLVTISGNVAYSTLSMTGGVPVDFMPPDFRQDDDGRVGVNVGAGAVRAQLDVISTSALPAFIADAHSTGNSFEARVAGVPKMVIDADGMVGFGTTAPQHQMHVEGDMRLTGRIYDSNMNSLWIPGSTLQWMPTLTAPVFTLPTAGVVAYSLQQGRYRYIGNEVVYNVNLSGSVTTRPTNITEDFKLNVPYAVSLSNYATPSIIGEMWLTATSADGTATNAFKAYARTITTDANNVQVRFLSGTTDVSMSTMLAGTTFSLQGQLVYNTPLVANVNGIVPTYIPAQITQDQQGRVGINMAGNTPTASLHVIANNTADTATIINQTAATGDILNIQKSAVTKVSIVNSGNVGIGTTNPLQPLHVQGTVQATTFSGSGASLTALNAGNVSTGTLAVARGGTGAATLTSSKVLVGNGTTAVLQPSNLHWDNVNSRLGINATSPSQALHVVGDTRIEGNLTVNGLQTFIDTNTQTTEQVIITNDGTGPALVVNQKGAQPILEFQDDGVPVMKIINDGNVGIGTTQPLQKLHVQGTVQATTFSGSGASLTALNAGNVSTGTLAVARGGTGAATLTSGKVLVGNGTTAVLQPTNLHWDNTNSRLGIGTATPTTKLDMLGSAVGTSGVIDVSREALVKFIRPATGGVQNSVSAQFEIGATLPLTVSTLDIKIAGAPGTVNTYGNIPDVTVMSLVGTGNVGIGTTDPTQKLHVQGNILSTGSIDAGTQFLGLATDLVTTPSFSWSGDTNTGMYRPGTDMVGLVTAGVEKVRVLANGNVGIGTTNPTQKLHVNGTLSSGQIISNSTLAPSGLGSSPAVNVANSKIVFYDFGGTNWCGTGVDTNGTWWLRTGVSATHLVVATYDGTVGIGITNPAEKLHVNGNIKMQGKLIGPTSDNLHLDSAISASAIYLNYYSTGQVFRSQNLSTFNTTSDERIKTSIELANTKTCWDNIKNIPLKRYQYNTNIKPSLINEDRNILGFIAQDVQKVLPKSVSISNDKESNIQDLMNLKLDQILYHMYGALQEAQKRIEALEFKLNNSL